MPGILPLLWLLTCSPALCGVIDKVPVVPTAAVSLRDPQFDEPLSRGILLSFNDQYKESVQAFDRLIKSYPDHPAPNFFEAAAYQSWMGSLRTGRFEGELLENIGEALRKGQKMLQENQDPWAYFYLGAAYGYRALYRFEKQDWISAYIDAGKGVEHFKEALEKEPRLYDAYLGLGSYHYWRSARSEFIRLIAFWIPDQRELGLRQLRFAFEHGRYGVHEAAYNLIAAYYDANQNEKAMEILDGTIRKKNAPGLTDLYYKGLLLARFKKWQEVEQTFRDLLKSLQGREIASAGYQIECRYWIALALAGQNRKAEATDVVEQALKEAENGKRPQELDGPFASFREITLKLFGLRYRLKQKEEGPIVTPP